MVVCVIVGTFNWIWVLCIFSDDVKFNSYYFSVVRPITFPQHAVFWFAIAYFLGIEMLCAHELIHRRELYSKLLGMWVHSKAFDLPFKDVHV